MSAPTTETPHGGPAAAAGAGAGGTWGVSWHGVRTVAVLELRQRVRSTRWVIVLVVWVLLLAVLTVLTRYAVHATAVPSPTGDGGPRPRRRGEPVRGGRPVRGDRLSSCSAWAASSRPRSRRRASTVTGRRRARSAADDPAHSLRDRAGQARRRLADGDGAVAAALPFVLWAYLDGGTPVSRLITTLAVLALTLLVVCAIGLGWSSLTARTASSTALTYLTVVFLGLGLPLLFALSVPLITSTDRVQVRTQHRRRRRSAAVHDGDAGAPAGPHRALVVVARRQPLRRGRGLGTDRPEPPGGRARRPPDRDP